ncbi:hypothetical protein Tco_1210357 [Tanacetum coccineum]
MLAPKGPTFNGRPTFTNPMYLKKAQSEKPCLYEIPYDQSDPANRLVPNREETLTLEKESQSLLNKDLVRPYDYTKLNSLYEIFNLATQEYHEQLAHANEVRKKMWRKPFVKSKPKIFKNIGFLPVSKSISKSRQAYNVMTNNINHFRELVDKAWEKHSHDHFHAPTAHDMEILIKTCLMPFAIKTHKLKKLIEKCKGKSVETKFDKPSVVRQPNAQRILKPSVLGKPAPFSDFLERKSFSKKKSVPKTNVLEGMYQINTRTTQTRAPQLPQTSRNTNPHLSTSTEVIYKNVSRPQLRSTQMKDNVVPNNSQVKDKTLNVNAICATCGKCVFNSNHDACVSKFLNDMKARTQKPNVVPISTRKPKSQVDKSVATPPKKTVAS